jgi:hypothetical protein
MEQAMARTEMRIVANDVIPIWQAMEHLVSDFQPARQ